MVTHLFLGSVLDRAVLGQISFWLCNWTPLRLVRNFSPRTSHRSKAENLWNYFCSYGKTFRRFVTSILKYACYSGGFLTVSIMTSKETKGHFRQSNQRLKYGTCITRKVSCPHEISPKWGAHLFLTTCALRRLSRADPDHEAEANTKDLQT